VKHAKNELGYFGSSLNPPKSPRAGGSALNGFAVIPKVSCENLPFVMVSRNIETLSRTGKISLELDSKLKFAFRIWHLNLLAS